jgi:hypothetical protein
MASHEPFGHLEPKLWAKEGPRVKLAVWLPTTKSRESPWSWHALGECDMALESSQGELPDWLRPRPDRRSGREVMMAQVPGMQTGTVSRLHFGSPRTKSHLGVGAIESNAENTIWGKVVASPQSGPWWVKWVQGRSWLVPTPKGCRMSSNQLVVGFWMQNRVTR